MTAHRQWAPVTRVSTEKVRVKDWEVGIDPTEEEKGAFVRTKEDIAEINRVLDELFGPEGSDAGLRTDPLPPTCGTCGWPARRPANGCAGPHKDPQ